MSKIVLISDTHLTKPKLPPGDILIHAGDLTFDGSITQVCRGMSWLGSHAKDYQKIFFVPGNHDWLFQKDYGIAKRICEENNVHLLLDSSHVWEGKRFYGAPWQPEFMGWAFNLPRGVELKRKWDQIPLDTDVLITHCPPYGIKDQVPDGEKVGCEDLMQKVLEIKPQLHVFGHIHWSYGMALFNGTTFVNASVCTEKYQPINPPIIVELE